VSQDLRRAPVNNLTSGEHKGQDAAVAKHRSTAKRGDKKLDVTTTLDFRVEGDKIARIDENSDQAAEDAIWS
jgi:hypothetical protein